jgi:hypothetical protein
MSTTKRTQLTKPTLNVDAALAFASGDHKPAKAASRETPSSSHRKTPATALEPGKSLSGLVPEGDVRLTANIREDLHLKLKIAAATRRTTIGELLEELIESHL